MAKAQRFILRTAAGDEPMPRAETPGAGLSKAITRAVAATEPGTWEVIEYGDLIYRVHRLNDPYFHVDVETLR